jgi:hypothetical protein
MVAQAARVQTMAPEVAVAAQATSLLAAQVVSAALARRASSSSWSGDHGPLQRDHNSGH